MIVLLKQREEIAVENTVEQVEIVEPLKEVESEVIIEKELDLVIASEQDVQTEPQTTPNTRQSARFKRGVCEEESRSLDRYSVKKAKVSADTTPVSKSAIPKFRTFGKSAFRTAGALRSIRKPLIEAQARQEIKPPQKKEFTFRMEKFDLEESLSKPLNYRPHSGT